MRRRIFAAVLLATMIGPGCAAQPEEVLPAEVLLVDSVSERLRWDVPDGWTQSSRALFLRLVTFEISEGTECYVTVLSGDGGGAAANFDRWRMQGGLTPLSSADRRRLPTLSLLGRDCQFLETHGPNGSSVGTMVLSSEEMVFVKMTGSEATVRAEVERFKEFCKSLRLEDG